jgi:Mg2+-importing ATPase
VLVAMSLATEVRPVPQSAVGRAATETPGSVLTDLGVTVGQGLSADEAARRRAAHGPNAVATHRASAVAVLSHQLRSPLLLLLVLAAAASALVGEHRDALIIGVIVTLSVGLGFGNEYRAERAAAALHSQVRHRALVVRDGTAALVDVEDLVPGDLVHLRVGDIVPADLRLLEAEELECDESVLTGESLPVAKSTDPVGSGTPLAELTGVALMGTVVHAGAGLGAVVATGTATELGTIATGLSTHQLDTTFQTGLRRFSLLLVRVAATLTTSIFVVNLLLHRPVMDSLLFSLAIAVGITPQLLPAVVATSLAAGSRRMSRRKVLVKRLVCIEDLGDVDVLFTDKTGTLTDGRVSFARAVPAVGSQALDVIRLGLLCTEEGSGAALGANPLDQALWAAPAVDTMTGWLEGHARLHSVPFSHHTRTMSVVVRDAAGVVTTVTKGAPEAVLERCRGVPPSARARLAAEFDAGSRVVAVATAPGRAADLQATDMRLIGLLVFLDPPKRGVERSLARLRGLGVTVKLVTGDNVAVAAKVCRDLGLSDGPEDVPLEGGDLDALDDAALARAIGRTSVFARVSPEQKARIVRVQRLSTGGVAFLGDGANDALALHAADVGISVDSATDVAKDAADVILLEKDLDVLADGVAEGRRIFANTVKYVLMGTSSNFGNMFSAAGASLFLAFLPMLPSQILLNNLLYDTSQLAIPTDGVDEEQLRRPSHWDIGFIRRFMLVFGPLSSVFDFATFWVMLHVFHAGPALFRSGWFVESLATQTLIIISIRTRRVPFFRSRPSVPLVVAVLGALGVGAVLPSSPLGPALGFRSLPVGFFLTLGGMVAAYLVLVEVGKTWFYRAAPVVPVVPARTTRHLRSRVWRFTTGHHLPPTATSAPSVPAPESHGPT